MIRKLLRKELSEARAEAKYLVSSTKNTKQKLRNTANLWKSLFH